MYQNNLVQLLTNEKKKKLEQLKTTQYLFNVANQLLQLLQSSKEPYWQKNITFCKKYQN